MRPLAALLVCLALASCSAVSVLGDAARPLDVYQLRVPPDLPRSGAQAYRQVVVEVPAATGILDTDRILVRPDPLAAQYLPEARRGEEAPLMVQTLLVRTLQETGGLLYVGERPVGSDGIAILTDLVAFEAQLSGEDTAVVRVAVEVRLIREEDAAIVGARRFAAEVPTTGTDTATLLAAFDAATQVMLTDFARWTLGRLGVRI